jgi:hypothetical protein
MPKVKRETVKKTNVNRAIVAVQENLPAHPVADIELAVPVPPVFAQPVNEDEPALGDGGEVVDPEGVERVNQAQLFDRAVIASSHQEKAPAHQPEIELDKEAATASMDVELVDQSIKDAVAVACEDIDAMAHTSPNRGEMRAEVASENIGFFAQVLGYFGAIKAFKEMERVAPALIDFGAEIAFEDIELVATDLVDDTEQRADLALQDIDSQALINKRASEDIASAPAVSCLSCYGTNPDCQGDAEFSSFRVGDPDLPGLSVLSFGTRLVI